MRSMVVVTVFGVLIPSMALCQTGVFRAAFTDPSTSSNPTGMGVGDYDHDGALDVVTCNAGVGGNDLTVHVGFNDGTLMEAGSGIPVNSFPSGLLQANFDGDAFDDLIITRGNDNTIVFLKGLGNSDFFAPPGPAIGVGQNPVGAAAADLDGDGKLDLVVADGGGDTTPGGITVLKGDGDGTFALVQQPDPSKPGMSTDSLPAELGTRAVAVGNIDSDPGLDVLAVNTRSNSISVYTSDGQGIFTPRGTLPAGDAPQDLALIDLNDDGKLDLVLAIADGDAVTVQLGNGDRTFGTAQSYPVGTAPTRIALGDLNGDHLLDIVASNSRSGDVSVLLATAPGVYGTARTFVADAEPQAVALGAFDKDGLLGAVTANLGAASATVALLRNRGGGVLHGVEDVRADNTPSGLVAADVDGDGLPDLLVSGSTGEVAIFPAQASGFGPPNRLNIGGRASGVAAADLNGDALPDIIAVDGANDRVAIFLSHGGGRFADPVFYPTAPGPNAVAVGDFDGDGRPDVALSTAGTDRTCQGGPQPGKSCTQDTDCAPGGVCAAPGKASVLLQQADGSFGPAHNSDVELRPVGIAALDINCDGKDDLLVANVASSTVSVLRSNGDGSFTLAQTLQQGDVGQSPIALAVADFNRDGVPDFAVTNIIAPQTTPNVHLFRGNCSGPFAAFPNGQVHVGELASALVARDFTGDQIVDLAVVSQTSNSVYLLTGNGDGTMTSSGADAVSRMPIAMAAADFDGDGRYDAASANNDASSNNVSVLLNCARDLESKGAPVNCDPFGRAGPTGAAALRGDGNGDGLRSAADLVAVAAEVADGDGVQVEDIGGGTFAASPGVDANGDGRVDAQDRLAVAHRIFGGA